MKIIGLTGGMGSGKSTVAAMLKKANIPIVDADHLAQEVTRIGSKALEEIVQTFGRDILNADSTLNRSKLANIVFEDRAKLLILEKIVHPKIERLAKQILLGLEKEGYDEVVYMAPLIFEKDLHTKFYKTLLIIARPDLILDRIYDRDGLSHWDAKKRIAAQLPDAEKIKLADEVVVNDGSIEELKAKLAVAWRRLTGKSI